MEDKNYSVAEVSEMIAESILQERMLTREVIASKVATYVKAFLGIKSKSVPALNPSKLPLAVRRMLRLEFEVKFWQSIVRSTALEHELEQDLIRLNKELTRRNLIG